MFLLIQNNLIFSNIILLLFCTSYYVIMGSIQNAIENKIYGKVTDQQDAVVSGTIVIIKRLENKQERKISSNEYGDFEFKNIEPGKYEISAQSDGFEISRKEIEVSSNNNIEVRFNLIVHNCDGIILKLDESKKLEPQYCQLHNIKLQLDIVSIEYGLVVVDYQAMDKNFPNSNNLYYGGCLADCYEKAEVLFCSKCRMAEKRWSKKHHSH